VQGYFIEWDENSFTGLGTVHVLNGTTVSPSVTSYVIGYRNTLTDQQDSTLKSGFTYMVRVSANNALGYVWGGVAQGCLVLVAYRLMHPGGLQWMHCHGAHPPQCRSLRTLYYLVHTPWSVWRRAPVVPLSSL
jgi:hypothetical protein